MRSEPPRPIFVVGSPRSGTSILTWCLGHHPNIFPVPESNWLGDFAVNVGIAYRTGAARGDYSILSAMDIGADELFAAFGRTIGDLILDHRDHLEKKREATCIERNLDRRWLEGSSRANGPKERWVDGTPEYSFHIWGLRKLFPEGRFVHLVRDVQAVVRSMLNFYRVTGIELVANEEGAYSYWMRTVKGCLLAERAYGPKVVRRISYADLLDQPDATMRSLLEFLGEPYEEKCLAPLELRINSSDVPAEFKADGPPANPKVVDEAVQLSGLLERTPQVTEASFNAAEEMEATFRERMRYMATVDSAYQSSQQVIESLKKSAPANPAAALSPQRP
jgi:hypothetical protein